MKKILGLFKYCGNNFATDVHAYSVRKIAFLKNSWRIVQVKVLIKILAFFFLVPSKQFLPLSQKIQLLVIFCNIGINILNTRKLFKECVREDTTHLATLKILKSW